MMIGRRGNKAGHNEVKKMSINSEMGDAFILEPKTIDSVSERVSDILGAFKVERKAILKIRLLVEDLLLHVLHSSNEPIACSVHFRKRLGRGVILIHYHGAPFDPLTQENDDFTSLYLDSFGIPCEWNYRNNTNTLLFSVNKQRKSSVPALLGAMLTALLLGFCSRWVPDFVTEAVSSYLLLPFKNAFLGLLNALAGVLVFFNITAGLCGDKRTEPLGAKSRQMLWRLPLLVTVITALGYLMLLPLSGVSFSAHRIGAESQASQVAELIWGIVPRNVVSPFIDGNYIQIMILALAFGMSLSAVRDHHPELVASISSINSVIMSVTEKLCRLIPLFVFCCLLNLVLSPVAEESLKDIWKPVVMFLVSGGLMSAIVFISLGIRYQCNSWKVLKAMLPALLIALTTGSPVAAYSTNVDILENRLGVSKRFSRVGLSISGKIYGPGIVLYLAVMLVFFAAKYQTPVDLGWVITAIVLTVLLTFACPPIPGSFLVIFGVMAKQFGFPDECMVILATADIILDGLSSGLCCLLRNAELVFEAGDYQELNRDALTNL